MGIVTLLSDFGDRDPYVGVMKGAIAMVDPHILTIDLTHQVPPQDIAAGRFALVSAVPDFPGGTVHLAVVDPGVGTGRRGVAIALENGYLVGPDNGLLTGVVDRHGAKAAVSLENPAYWRTPQPSPTFHGRDIFAPVAAHLALGVPLTELGPPLALGALIRLDIPAPQRQGDSWRGHIQAIDHFGNLITTLAAPLPPGTLCLGERPIPWGQTYGAVPPDHPVALVGSHGYGEIAIHGGSAQAHFQAQVGDVVKLMPP